MRKGTVEVESVNNKNSGGEKKEKMKTKTKVITLMQIAIVLCSVFLVAIPAIAADQAMQKVSVSTITTAAEDDYVLGIYGNANEDDTIDMGDVVYTKLAIFGKKAKTELCDAKYDGLINVLDVIQTKLIILGKEREITLIDLADRVVTVKKPVERLVVTWRGQLEIPRSLKIEPDRVVGVESYIQQGDYKIFFAEYQDKPAIGSIWNPDIEAILKLRPDVVLLVNCDCCGSTHDKNQAVLERAGITVVRVTGGVYGERIAEEAEKLGYILDKEAEADEFIDFYEGVANSIKEKVENIPKDDRPKVYFESSRYSTSGERSGHIEATGGKNIFEGKSGKVDPEAVARFNPDIIVLGRGIGGLATDDTTEFEEAREELMIRPELQKVTAVKTGKVYVLSTFITGSGSKAGCRSFVQDAYQAKWFNPTYFEELDPKALHQEYLTRFQGLDFDLDKHGVYVYHPEEHPDGN